MEFNLFHHYSYLWSKEVCFVLPSWDLPNHSTSCRALGIFGKLSMSRGASTWLVWDCLELWCGSYQLLNHFLNENHIKLKLKTWGCSWCYCKALDKSDLIEFISRFSELRCERECDFWMNFVAGNSNKLQKLSLQAKFSWALNVFTLGPMAQATLVSMKIK
jgi:hypothetical protein